MGPTTSLNMTYLHCSTPPDRTQLSRARQVDLSGHGRLVRQAGAAGYCPRGTFSAGAVGWCPRRWVSAGAHGGRVSQAQLVGAHCGQRRGKRRGGGCSRRKRNEIKYSIILFDSKYSSNGIHETKSNITLFTNRGIFVFSIDI